MVKKFSVFLALLIFIFIAGCTRVPDDVTQAEFTGNSADMGETQDDQMSEEDMSEEETSGSPGIPENAVFLDKENSFFEFEGYAPGKSHVGTLTEWDGYAVIENNVIQKIEMTFDMNSVDTGIGALDDHLMSEDFYHAEEHPISTMTTTEIGAEKTTALMDFRGVRQEIIIPTDELSSDVFATEFLLNMSNYGIDHPAADEMVRMEFRLVPEN